MSGRRLGSAAESPDARRERWPRSRGRPGGPGRRSGSGGAGGALRPHWPGMRSGEGDRARVLVQPVPPGEQQCWSRVPRCSRQARQSRRASRLRGSGGTGRGRLPRRTVPPRPAWPVVRVRSSALRPRAANTAAIHAEANYVARAAGHGRAEARGQRPVGTCRGSPGLDGGQAKVMPRPQPICRPCQAPVIVAPPPEITSVPVRRGRAATAGAGCRAHRGTARTSRTPGYPSSRRPPRGAR